MRIALDAQLTVGTPTGIGEYALGLAVALRAEGVDVVELYDANLNPWRFDRRVWWDQVELPAQARAAHADLLHCASGTMPLSLSLPVVVTVHDIAWLRVQAHARFYARLYFGAFSLGRYRAARRIVVDSQFSRSELLALLPTYDPQHVEVVYPGVARDFCELQRRGGDGRTVLVVGTVERRKNLEVVIRALALMQHARILSVGPATPYQMECRRLAEQLGVGDRVEFLGYVDRPRLLDLYASSAVLALPSRYEGFGYAAAQALCAGLPCVVSDCSSLPEVVENAAPVVAVDDSAAWAGALTGALGAGSLRAAQVRAASISRFAWPESARRMVDVYRSALEG